MNVFNAIVLEARGFFDSVVVSWPSTPVGFVLRRRLWRRRTGATRIVVARGARISGSEHIQFGEDNEIGENVEFVADGQDGLQVYVGSNIMFARGVYLRSSNHAFGDRARLIREQGHESKRTSFRGVDYAIVIEDDCWIGANVVVLSGAHIGCGCVIAAGAVVAGTIPPYTVAGGVPARIIAERG